MERQWGTQQLACQAGWHLPAWSPGYAAPGKFSDHAHSSGSNASLAEYLLQSPSVSENTVFERDFAQLQRGKQFCHVFS
jgi:hypothetical protein